MTASLVAATLAWSQITAAQGVTDAQQSAQNADESPSPDENLATMIGLVDRLELRAGKDAKLLKRLPPIQRWDNPIGEGVPDATLFLWTREQRPVVASQVFRIGNSPWLQEFQSLTDLPIYGSHQDKRFWETETSGLQWKDIPASAPAPAPSERLRLLQMRSLARRFTAFQKSDTDSPNLLRLLPTPLYRYRHEDDGILDGALFSFAPGTDPEVLMLIEARRGNSAGEMPVWKVAFAPMTIFACRVTLEGQEIWSCRYRPQPYKIDNTFMFLNYGEE